MEGNAQQKIQSKTKNSTGDENRNQRQKIQPELFVSDGYFFFDWLPYADFYSAREKKFSCSLVALLY